MYVNHRADGRWIELLDEPESQYAGVVDEGVDPAPAIDRGLDEARAPSSVLTLCVSATASPPPAMISRAMSSAFAGATPLPSGPAPRSLTSTRAPRLASSRA